MKKFAYSPAKMLFLVILFIGLFISSPVRAQTNSLMDYYPEIKITDSNGPEPGYFFASSKTLESASDTFYLAIFDNYGTPLFFRLMPGLCTGFTVQPNGFLSYSFGDPRRIFMMDSLFQVVDTFTTEGYKIDPHGYYITAEGHALLLGNKRRTVDMSVIVEGGNPAATIRDKVVQEFDEQGNLLYTWKFWEHYEITDANENSPFVDLTASTIDYAHPNDITTDSDTSFLLSNRHMDEITKVDRRTGDIIWRLGGENNDFTFVDDSIYFSHQHSISILSNGNLLLFDNGNLHDLPFSSTVEYQLDEENLTATLITRIRRIPDMFSGHSGCTQRLANGNTIIGWGPFVPSATEFFPDGSKAIEIDFSNHSFSNPITKFPWKQKVFETNNDSVNFGMWDGYTESYYLLNVTNNLDYTISITSYSTNTEHFSIEETMPVEIPAGGNIDLTIVYYPENATTGFITDILTINYDTDNQRIAAQVYLTGKKQDNTSPDLAITPQGDNIAVDTVITLSFSEPVRKTDDTELNYANVDDMVELKVNDAGGADIAFDAIINTEKNIITVVPEDSLDTGTIYYAGIKSGIEDYSDNEMDASGSTFITFSPVLVNKIEEYPGLKIFPNPTSGKFTIDITGSDAEIIRVFSVDGRVVFEKDNISKGLFQIDLSDKPAGFFLIQIKQGDRIKQAGIVKE